MSRGLIKNIVVIGGGTGTFSVLSGLKKYSNINPIAIVSMADDGGSTGILREEFGILPPGSVRPALIALSHAEKYVADLFQFRFSVGQLTGHNLGNLLITALAQKYGDFEKAIEIAGKILNIKGQVIPSTLDNAKLCAKLEDGTIIKGETNIDIPKHNPNLKIEKVWLEPTCKANPKALEAIKKADLIVIGPGDLFSSIIPNMLPKGVVIALKKSKAKKVYVCNMMTKLGETNGFSALDFVDTIEKYIGQRMLNFAIFNTKKPQSYRIKKYEKEGAEFVTFNKGEIEKRGVRVISGNLLRAKGFIRHDPQKLAKVILSLI